MKAAIGMLLGVAALALSGCTSSKCDNVCQKFNQCTLKQRDHSFDCANTCSNVEAFQDRAGSASCEALYLAHLECWERNIAQICNAQSEVCTASGTEWVECLTAYCAKNTKDPICIPSAEENKPPAPGFTPF